MTPVLATALPPASRRIAAVLALLAAACSGGGGSSNPGGDPNGGGGTPPPGVDVFRSGAGGKVVSSPAGIDCGSTCAMAFDPGTVVTLTAIPDASGAFDGWSEDCAAAGTATTCTLTVLARSHARAAFRLLPPPAPQNLHVEPHAGDATLSWDEVPGATQYFVYVASEPGVTKTSYATLAEGARHGPWPDPVNLAQLVQGRRYYVVVTAANVAGEGPESDEVSFIFGPPPDPHFKWKYAAGGPIYYSAPALSPAGKIVFGTGAPFAPAEAARKVIALNADGTLAWEHATGVNMYSPAVDADGNVYVQDADSTLYKLAAADGAELWKIARTTTSAVGLAAPAIDDPEVGAVYYVADALYAVSTDGTPRWRYEPTGTLGPPALRSSPAIAADGTLYFGVNGPVFDGGSVGAALFAVRRDGTLRWRTVLAGTDFAFSSPALGANGMVYLGTETNGTPPTGAVHAIDPDGVVSWSYVTSGPVRSSPALDAGGRIVVGVKASGDTPGALVALEPDGTLAWSYSVGVTAADVYSSPAVGADGMVYFGAETGRLYAIDPDGVASWSFDSQNGINWTSPAVAADGTLYFGNNDGNLFALTTSSHGLAATPWPRFRGGNAGTGRAP